VVFCSPLCPFCLIVFVSLLHCKYKYKIAIKMLHLHLNGIWMMSCLNTTFGRIWINFGKNGKKGFQKKTKYFTITFTDSQDIANQFKEAFSDYCFDSYNDKDRIAELCAKLSNSDDDDELHNRQYNVADVEKALEKLKLGKASGFDGIVKEHLLYSHPSIVVCIMLLFNMMSIHCVVPDAF